MPLVEDLVAAHWMSFSCNHMDHNDNYTHLCPKCWAVAVAAAAAAAVDDVTAAVAADFAVGIFRWPLVG